MGSFPIPHVNEILSDIAQDHIFAPLDMTNSFFQTCMHPEGIDLTMVNTPWGLYKWVVMPMASGMPQKSTSTALP